MDLEEFIKTALIDIVQAIEEAKSELDDKADYICPIMNLHDAAQCNITRTHDGKYYQSAEFDIAVTAESGTDAGGKATLNVLSLKASLGSNLKSNSSTASRVKFSVPLGLPSKRQK